MDKLLVVLIKLFIFLSGFTKKLSRLGGGAYEEWSPGKKLKLLMVGYNGARNTGADARVAAAKRQRSGSIWILKCRNTGKNRKRWAGS